MRKIATRSAVVCGKPGQGGHPYSLYLRIPPVLPPRARPTAGGMLSECRLGRNTRHLLAGLLWQSVFGRLAGYEDVKDA